jgi:hypothetical protein
MIILKSLENLGTICPSQWEGETIDGKYCYIRCRHGLLKEDSQNDISKMFGVSRTSIQQIVENRSYLKERFI